MSMSQRSIVASTKRRPYVSTSFLPHARSDLEALRQRQTEFMRQLDARAAARRRRKRQRTLRARAARAWRRFNAWLQEPLSPTEVAIWHALAAPGRGAARLGRTAYRETRRLTAEYQAARRARVEAEPRPNPKPAPAPSQRIQEPAKAPTTSQPAQTAAAPNYDAEAAALMQRMRDLQIARLQQRFAEQGVLEDRPIQPLFQVPNSRHLELSHQGTIEFRDDETNELLESRPCTTGAAIRISAFVEGKRRRRSRSWSRRCCRSIEPNWPGGASARRTGDRGSTIRPWRVELKGAMQCRSVQ